MVLETPQVENHPVPQKNKENTIKFLALLGEQWYSIIAGGLVKLIFFCWLVFTGSEGDSLSSCEVRFASLCCFRMRSLNRGTQIVYLNCQATLGNLLLVTLFEPGGVFFQTEYFSFVVLRDDFKICSLKSQCQFYVHRSQMSKSSNGATSELSIRHKYLSMPLTALLTGSCSSQKLLPLFSYYLYGVNLE